MTYVHILTKPGEVFHLPDKHDQKSHGNRAGKKNNISSKTSRHAPSDTKTDSSTKRSRKSIPTKPMTGAEFNARANEAAQGEEVFGQVVVTDKMNSVEDLIDAGKLSDLTVEDVRSAYDQYTGTHYGFINRRLRATNRVDSLPSSNRKTVETLDQVMAASPLAHDIVVQRGIANPRKMFGNAFNVSDDPDANRGLTWVDNAYVSTTTSKRVAKGFGTNVVMNILVPKGTLATGTPHSRHPREREIILPRGTKFRVVSSYQDGSVENRMILNVEVIP